MKTWRIELDDVPDLPVLLDLLGLTVEGDALITQPLDDDDLHRLFDRLHDAGLVLVNATEV